MEKKEEFKDFKKERLKERVRDMLIFYLTFLAMVLLSAIAIKEKSTSYLVLFYITSLPLIIHEKVTKGRFDLIDKEELFLFSFAALIGYLILI